MRNQITVGQVAELQAALRARYRALREEVRQDLLKADDDRAELAAGGVRDLEDESVADLIVDLDLADTDRDLEESREVQAALVRIKEGFYGVCSHCGGPIPLERLTACPTARRCEPCQRLHEKTFAQKGMASL